jgi:hypothetical protein
LKVDGHEVARSMREDEQKKKRGDGPSRKTRICPAREMKEIPARELAGSQAFRGNPERI